jgi:hypothetical protein
MKKRQKKEGLSPRALRHRLEALCNFAADPDGGPPWPHEALAPLRELARCLTQGRLAGTEGIGPGADQVPIEDLILEASVAIFPGGGLRIDWNTNGPAADLQIRAYPDGLGGSSEYTATVPEWDLRRPVGARRAIYRALLTIRNAYVAHIEQQDRPGPELLNPIRA